MQSAVPLRNIFMIRSLNEGILMQLPDEREASRTDMARRLSEHTQSPCLRQPILSAVSVWTGPPS